MSRKFQVRILTWALLSACALPLPAPSLAAGGDTEVLDLSLEELMKVVVTSVARKPQTLANTAAAAFVISAEDIRRSGATNIPEALRLAPGVHVAAIGNNKWAVSIRGFNGRFANKLLVLVDGRSVYTPLFSGVFWENLDVPLENIERIEVIRGPGASIWGANAVNGVINIITRSAFETQAGQAAVEAGTELRGGAFARYGWQPDPDTAVRAHVNAQDVGPSQLAARGGEGFDDWRNLGAGFRLDRRLAQGSLLVEGGLSSSRTGDELTLFSAPPAESLVRFTQKTEGMNLLGRWDRNRSGTLQESWQAFLEYSRFDHAILDERRTTLDLQYQQRLTNLEGQDLIWGLGYRYSADAINSSPTIQFADSERATSLYSTYVQDEITLSPELLRLTLGARLEHNDYTGFDLQPNVRLLWTPNPDSSAWISLARATRSPARVERGMTVNLQADPVGTPPYIPPYLVQVYTNQLGEEKLDALDLGWRQQLSPTASLDLAAFYYRYHDLRSGQTQAPVFIYPPGYLLIEVQGDTNTETARTRGLEASLDWRPQPAWRLQASYSWLHLDKGSSSEAGQIPDNFTSSPSHIFSLLSSVDLTSSLRWDTWLRYQSEIPTLGIPAYTSLDLRLAWRLNKSVELSVVGQNLLDSVHPEVLSDFILSTPTEIQRGVYFRADWKF